MIGSGCGVIAGKPHKFLFLVIADTRPFISSYLHACFTPHFRILPHLSLPHLSSRLPDIDFSPFTPHCHVRPHSFKPPASFLTQHRYTALTHSSTLDNPRQPSPMHATLVFPPHHLPGSVSSLCYMQSQPHLDLQPIYHARHTSATRLTSPSMSRHCSTAYHSMLQPVLPPAYLSWLSELSGYVRCVAFSQA